MFDLASIRVLISSWQNIHLMLIDFDGNLSMTTVGPSILIPMNRIKTNKVKNEWDKFQSKQTLSSIWLLNYYCWWLGLRLSLRHRHSWITRTRIRWGRLIWSIWRLFFIKIQIKSRCIRCRCISTDIWIHTHYGSKERLSRNESKNVIIKPKIWTNNKVKNLMRKK